MQSGHCIFLGLVLGFTVGCGSTSKPGLEQPTELAEIQVSVELPSSQKDPGPVELQEVCNAYESPAAVGFLEGDLLAEISGLVHSRRNPEILWVHNDSGDSARIYGINLQGALRIVVDLDGIDAVDFEDIGVGGCPTTENTCLWIGDIGDNDRKRESIKVHVILDPLVDSSEAEVQNLKVAPVRTFTINYPNGPINSEALVVSKDGSSLWIFEKTETGRTAGVYKTPGDLRDHPEHIPLMMEAIGNFDAPGLNVPHGYKITAADVHPSEKALIIRTYPGFWQYDLDSLEDLSQLNEVQSTIVALGPLTEPQGEAIAFHIDGRSIWTLSEDPKSLGNQPLNQTSCLPERPQTEE